MAMVMYTVALSHLQVHWYRLVITKRAEKSTRSPSSRYVGDLHALKRERTALTGMPGSRGANSSSAKEEMTE